MRIQVRADYRSRFPDERVFPTLSPRATYYVLGVSNEDYRVINDRGEPILFPKVLFEVVDRAIPAGWQLAEFEEGEYHLQPGAVARPGFYNDYFWSDGDYEAQRVARQVLRGVLERALEEATGDDRRQIVRDLARMTTSWVTPMPPPGFRSR